MMKSCRTRLWAGGNLGMAQTLLSNVECWLHHMRLDSETGLDADGVHLRPAQGLEAVDYFVPGYAVWAKMIASLADLGYDSNNLVGISLGYLLTQHRRQRSYANPIEKVFSLVLGQDGNTD